MDCSAADGLENFLIITCIRSERFNLSFARQRLLVFLVNFAQEIGALAAKIDSLNLCHSMSLSD